MTISSTTNRVSFSGNGVTTAFSFPYYFLVNADLIVVLRSSAGVETTQTITTHYTVSGAANPAGGTVTMVTAPASGETLTIYRDPARTQDLDLVENDEMPAEEIEKRFDKLTMIAQRLADLQARTFKLKETDSAATLELPLLADRASNYLAFDASGLPIASSGDVANVTVSAYMATVLDDTTAAAARTTLGFTGASGTVATANIEDLAVSTGKIAALAVTDAKLAADAVTTAKILNSNVTTAKIADANVTRAKLAPGAFSADVKTKTANYTVTTSDDILVATSGTFTFTLPTAVGIGGKIFTFINDGTGNITLDGDGSETIAGLTTYFMAVQGESVSIISDGANWRVLEKQSPYRFYAARIANGGSASIASQTGNWISSVTRNGAGDVSISFTSGVFTVEPFITATVIASATPNRTTVIDAAATTSGCKIFTGIATTGGNNDHGFEIIAVGK